jgi:hypothetical protein
MAITSKCGGAICRPHLRKQTVIERKWNISKKISGYSGVSQRGTSNNQN